MDHDANQLPIENRLREAEARLREAEELNEIFLNSLPLIMNIWDENYKLISTSQQAVELFGLSNQELYIERFFELSPEYQPCGERSQEKALYYVKQAFREGRVKFEWMHQNLYGEELPAEIVLVRFARYGKYFVAAYIFDLRTIKKVIENEHEANEINRIFIDTSPFAMGMRDENYNPIYCNSQLLELFGLSSYDEYRKRFFELCPERQPCGTPSDQKALEHMKIAMEKGRHRFEFVHYTADGKLLPTDITLIRIKRQGKNMLAGYIIDLRPLRQAEEESRILFDSCPMFIEVWDDEFNLIGCSQKVVDFFGLANKEEYISRYGELSPKYQPCGTLSVEKAVILARKTFEEGYVRDEWVHIDQITGELFPVEITMVRIRRGGRDVAVGYNHDLRPIKDVLAKMREANSKAREAEELNKLILDASPMCIEMWDDRQNMIYCNNKALNAANVNSFEDYRDRFAELMIPCRTDGTPSENKLSDLLDEAAREGSAQFEWTHRDKDGAQVTYETHLARITRNGRNEIVGYSHDISEIKRAIAEIREADERTALMFDATPLSCIMAKRVTTENGSIRFAAVDCNQAAVDLFDFSGKEETIARFLDIFLKPSEDESILDMAFEDAAIAFDNGFHQFEFTHRNVHGEYIPCKITMVRVNYKGEPMLACYQHDLRQIKAAMSKERESFELTQIILDSAPFIINIWDDNYNIVSTNKRAFELYGFSEQDKYINDFFSFSPEYQPCGTYSREKGINYLKEAYQSGRAQFEWVHQSLDGKLFPTEITLVRSKHKDATILLEYTTDLRRVKAAEDLTRKLLDNAPMFMKFWDAKGNLLDCNKRFLDIFKIKNKAEFTKRFYEFSAAYQPCGTSPEEKNIALINYVIQQGSYSAEWTFVLPSGEELPVNATWVHIVHNGESMILVYSHDLRPIKAAIKRERELETKLREQEMNRRIELMFDAAPLIITYWDKSHQAIDCNQTALDFYGYSNKKEYMGDIVNISTEFQPDGSPSVESQKNHLDTIFETGSDSFEYTGRKSNGDVVFLQVEGIRIKYDDEFVAITYSKDITQLRELQREQQRIEIAEESNRAKSRFLARMSHEIRTPITAVLGISEIQLRNTALSPIIEESFAKIYNSANILLDIVNDILDLSKIEAGKMSLLCEEYETSSLIVDAVQCHIVNLGYKNLEFHVHVDENLPKLLAGDSLRIKQVINNILSNAFKYTKSGSVELSMHCQEYASEESYVTLVISIRDTGLGMTPDQIDRLYSDYTRFHEHEVRSAIGTGLGMPIVYNLLKLMDADIDIESEVGVGTNVIVRIPQKIVGSEVLGRKLADSLQNFEVSAQSVEKKFKFVPEPMPYGRVLVVDDVSANLYVAHGLLSFYSLNIETCDNGYDAIEKIKQGRVYDIVFMDQMMPGINGTETMRLMRDIGYTEPIVALTANALIGQAEEFIRNGFDGFISKPIQTVHLNTILTKHIRDKQPPEVLEAAISGSLEHSEGIDNYQNNADVVEKLRSDFAANQKNAFLEISQAITSGDIKTAHRLAHTLKGLAGLVHESDLAQAAAHVEYILESGEIPSNDKLFALKNELARVLNNIGKPEAMILSGKLVLDVDKAISLLDRLKPLLEHRKAECLNLLEELRTIPETAILVRQIEKFDFASALKSMNTLRAILEEQ
ncbi:MAG: PAS domain-containing protein [Defluviitaleaceae bacterium]|nr:PAS domain-containing protein [Defluviitaleaceae bacterium]